MDKNTSYTNNHLSTHWIADIHWIYAIRQYRDIEKRPVWCKLMVYCWQSTAWLIIMLLMKIIQSYFLWKHA